jgi:hypothetical protein
MIASFPTVSSDREWEFSENRGCYVSKPVETTKTKKITKPLVLAPATKEHPAQVEKVSEDVVEGIWQAIHLSGAISETKKQEYLDRVRKLQKAVIMARELANEIKALPDAKPVKTLFEYIFGS